LQHKYPLQSYIYITIYSIESYKSSNPQYINKSGIEIDFFTADKMLIEVKYGGELTEKQKMLFEGIEAKKKFIVQNLKDLEELTKNI